MQLRDYREATGRYDVIVSVEMIEAVGERYWPAYFTAIDRLLAPAGGPGSRRSPCRTTGCSPPGAATPGSTSTSSRAARSRRVQAITDVLRARTGLRVTADYPMGPHYARTLREWRGQFADAADAVSELGFGPVFQRMWELYLAYSEAGFRAGYLDVHQLCWNGPRRDRLGDAVHPGPAAHRQPGPQPRRPRRRRWSRCSSGTRDPRGGGRERQPAGFLLDALHDLDAACARPAGALVSRARALGATR